MRRLFTVVEIKVRSMVAPYGGFLEALLVGRSSDGRDCSHIIRNGFCREAAVSPKVGLVCLLLGADGGLLVSPGVYELVLPKV